MAPPAVQFKVKLSSGRILGPLDLERVRLLIKKNQIIGVETARYYPQGEWIDINAIPEIAEILVARASGEPTRVKTFSDAGYPFHESGGLSATVPLPSQTQAMGATRPLQELRELPETPEVSQTEERTQMAIEAEPQAASPENMEATQVTSAGQSLDDAALEDAGVHLEIEDATSSATSSGTYNEIGVDFQPNRIAHEKTVVFQRSTDAVGLPGKPKRKLSETLKKVIVVLAVLMMMHELMFGDAEVTSGPVKYAPIRPQLPEAVQGKSDPSLSAKLYGEAMKPYVLDHVQGYRDAAQKLRASAAQDMTNVKALAMLASSYLNLIDASNKDENYFSVISKLIEMSRAKDVDLAETVIADVEFFITINKPEAAQVRIVEYTKTHRNFGLEMFYYLALAFYQRGDAQNAATYINNIPDSKAFSVKIFHLKGLIAEKLGDQESALREYSKAVQTNPQHVRSRLRIAELLNQQGKIKESASHLEYIMTHTRLLPPKEMARAYYLHSQLSGLYKKWDLALGDVERAVKLDKDNHDYLLELYTLRARVGDSVKSVQKQARMYFFLGEGEKLLRVGNYQDALNQFLQARQSSEESPLPPLKIGDLFGYLHDVQNARLNYKLAADRAPNNIEIWSKYIDSLIQTYEWEEAQQAMDRFRKLPVPQSALDKAAADMYQKQGRPGEAQVYYRKAMARETIDPDVYIAYAKSLMSTHNYKDAPFFFALALRFDPLNLDALIGTAKCIAETESIDRAINMLQDELQKQKSQRAELLAAVAELQIQKGAWDLAQVNVEQAMAANPDYAMPWKLQAQIHMNRDGTDRKAVDNALAAYKSYSDRNASDPSGYLERYKLFVRKADFEKANEELNRVYAIYPKYPNLHFYKGAMYGIMGNHKVAAEEFTAELKNNPNNVQAILSLGKELIELGDYEAAIKQFTTAMQRAPQSAEPKHYAGWANCLNKSFAAGITLFQAALRIDQANPVIHKRMATCYHWAGDHRNAALSAQKYLQMEPDAPDKADYEAMYR